MTAIISACNTYRYRLERDVSVDGIVFAYFGVNGSTATATLDDYMVTKWIGFTKLNQGRRFIVGNAFAYRARDVGELGQALDPIGPENDAHIDQIIKDADIIVPCWGSRTKLPTRLHARLDALRERLFNSGKPVKIWGLSKSGDPLHPLMLAYTTPFTNWTR
jgi:hypothetical protein